MRVIDGKELYTQKELAEIIGRTPGTICQLIKRTDMLPYKKVGNICLYTEEQLQELTEKHNEILRNHNKKKETSNQTNSNTPNVNTQVRTSVVKPLNITIELSDRLYNLLEKLIPRQSVLFSGNPKKKESEHNPRIPLRSFGDDEWPDPMPKCLKDDDDGEYDGSAF